MSFGTFFDDDDDEMIELEQGFIDQFTHGRTTISLSDSCITKDDDEDDDWTKIIQASDAQIDETFEITDDSDSVNTTDTTDTTEEDALCIEVKNEDEQWDRLLKEAKIIEQKQYSEELSLEVRRQQRREYQQRYRKGMIAPRQARTIQRSVGNGHKESRKKFAYYLPFHVADNLRTSVDLLGIKRREFVKDALEAFLNSKPNLNKDVIKKRRYDQDEKKFLYDEIPESLWKRVDNFCYKNDVRLANHYQIAEIAIERALSNI